MLNDFLNEWFLVEKYMQGQMEEDDRLILEERFDWDPKVRDAFLRHGYIPDCAHDESLTVRELKVMLEALTRKHQDYVALLSEIEAMVSGVTPATVLKWDENARAVTTHSVAAEGTKVGAEVEKLKDKNGIRYQIFTRDDPRFEVGIPASRENEFGVIVIELVHENQAVGVPLLLPLVFDNEGFCIYHDQSLTLFEADLDPKALENCSLRFYSDRDALLELCMCDQAEQLLVQFNYLPEDWKKKVNNLIDELKNL